MYACAVGFFWVFFGGWRAASTDLANLRIFLSTCTSHIEISPKLCHLHFKSYGTCEHAVQKSGRGGEVMAGQAFLSLLKENGLVFGRFWLIKRGSKAWEPCLCHCLIYLSRHEQHLHAHELPSSLSLSDNHYHHGLIRSRFGASHSEVALWCHVVRGRREHGEAQGGLCVMFSTGERRKCRTCIMRRLRPLHLHDLPSKKAHRC